MSSLGFQTVYRLLNDYDDIVCERAFVSGIRSEEVPRSVESGAPVSEFDLVAFSVSYENDYIHVVSFLKSGRLPPNSLDRGSPHPFVVAGGVALSLNPEPLAPFLDMVFIGEAEAILPAFVEFFDPETKRTSLLKTLAANVPGIYIPSLYETKTGGKGLHEGLFPLVSEAPRPVVRASLPHITGVSTCSAIIPRQAAFDNMYMIEVARGCPHGCRFCAAGYICRPPRYRPVPELIEDVSRGSEFTGKIGLVGAAVSNLPGISQLIGHNFGKEIHFSFSSLRADALTDDLVSALKKSAVKTATIAPDAGSERMRNIINKNISETNVLAAAEKLVSAGISNLKIYFMVGLPFETTEDVEEIVKLVKKIKHTFLIASKSRGKIGEITVSVSSFVPKPFTPFQWAAMNDVRTLKDKIKRIKDGLKRVANVRVYPDVPRWAYIQGLLSRGDRNVADILLLALKNGGNWPKTFKETPINPDFYTLRERSTEEILPWDFIDHGIDKSYLLRELKRAEAEKKTPPCHVETCRACGVCAD